MAHISEALYSLLRGDEGVSMLAGDRIRRLVIDPKETTPFVQLQLIGLVPEITLSGGHPLHTAAVEVSAWADDYDTARALTEALRAAMDDFVNGAVAEVSITHILQIDEEEQGVELAADRVLVRILQTYEIQYRS